MFRLDQKSKEHPNDTIYNEHQSEFMHVLTDSAMYSLEPFNTVAIPKSPSFTKPVLVRNMFRVFMSLKRVDKDERLATKCIKYFNYILVPGLGWASITRNKLVYQYASHQPHMTNPASGTLKLQLSGKIKEEIISIELTKLNTT